MIQKIKNCKELIPYLKNTIEDEGIKVGRFPICEE